MPNDYLRDDYVPALPGGATLANLFGKRPEPPKPEPEAAPAADSPAAELLAHLEAR